MYLVIINFHFHTSDIPEYKSSKTPFDTLILTRDPSLHHSVVILRLNHFISY